MSFVDSRTILKAATQVGMSDPVDGLKDPAFSSFLTGTDGTLHAVVDVYGTHDNEHWRWLGKLTMDVANWTDKSDDKTDDFWIKTSWSRFRCDVTELTGNGAAVSVHAGG